MRVVVGVRRRRRRLALRCFLLSSAFSTLVGLLLLSSSRSDDLPLKAAVVAKVADTTSRSDVGGNKTCATVEEMGEVFRGGSLKEALRLRKIIQNHFAINGAPRVRKLSPKEFCRHGFVLGKASEAGFGNEMYKILTGAALSVMLNRSLIIGQTSAVLIKD